MLDFPVLQIRVGYNKPKTYVLTPSRKHLGKAVARKSQQVIAVETLKNPVTRRVLSLIGREIQEIKAMSSDKTHSILSTESLKEFEWRTLLEELHTNAPVLVGILQAATKTRVTRLNGGAIVGMYASILMKHRNPKMNLLQKIVSLVLYSGHAFKQVYHMGASDFAKMKCITCCHFRYMIGCKN